MPTSETETNFVIKDKKEKKTTVQKGKKEK